MTDRIGQKLGNYHLVRLLGEGGFAEVYLGEHIHLGTEAAIKVLGHKSKLLGLEAPKRMEMTGKDSGPLTIELFRQLCDEAEKETDGKEEDK